MPVNEYFLDHPEMVLGELGAVGGAYRADDLTVTAAGDTIAALTAGLDRITTAARARGLTWTAAAGTGQPAAQQAPASQHPDGYLEARARRHLHRGRGRRSPARSRCRAPRPPSCAHCCGSATRAVALLQAEAAHRKTPLIPNGCAVSSTAAMTSTSGPTGHSTGSRCAGPGAPTRPPASRSWRASRPPQGGFRGDPFAPLVYALEEFDPAGQRAAKAAIFTRRVVAPRTPRLGADTAADALAICLDTRGEARLDEIARLLGVSEDQARDDLGTLVFDDPQSGRLVPAAEYLSGNVRDKLRAAEHAAGDDPRFEVNAAELRAVIPADLTPGEIDARLGAAWIDARYVEQFLREILDDPRLRVEHPGGQIWAVRGNRRQRPGRLHLGHRTLPRAAARPGHPGTAQDRGPRRRAHPRR